MIVTLAAVEDGRTPGQMFQRFFPTPAKDFSGVTVGFLHGTVRKLIHDELRRVAL
jgi:hypothetical protein